MSVPLVTKGMIANGSVVINNNVQKFVLPLNINIKQEPIELKIKNQEKLVLHIKKICG